jgi:hypothetical protein
VTKSNLVDTVPGDILLRRAYIEASGEHGYWLSQAQVNESKREISNPSKDQAEIPEWQFLQVHESGTSTKADFAFGSNQVNYEEDKTLSCPLTQEVEEPFVYEKSELELPHVSFDTLEQFSSENYQQLVTTMISHLSTAVLGESFAAEALLPKMSKRGESRLPSFLQSNSRGYRQPKENPHFRSNSLQCRAVPPPSHFSISAVEPLHFLGITPTVQSAELLQVCKLKTSNIMK